MKKSNNELLVSLETYLTSGVHIGTKSSNKQMNKYILSIRRDGLRIFDINYTDLAIRKTASILSLYYPKDILVVTNRPYAIYPMKQLARICNFQFIGGRFIPGTLTNIKNPNFMEPKIIIISDPKIDYQALQEAQKMNIPVVSLCDTDNQINYIDLIIPCNNRGRRSIARVILLLINQILREKGDIGEYEELDLAIEEITYKIQKLSNIRKVFRGLN